MHCCVPGTNVFEPARCHPQHASASVSNACPNRGPQSALQAAGTCYKCLLLSVNLSGRCTLLQVVVVPDDVAAIASEVSSMSQELEVVITSGGVGPTLDDVTMEGVAQAMGKPLVR